MDGFEPRRGGGIPTLVRLRRPCTARGLLIGPNGLLSAAIAVANGLTLVTHNTVELSRVVGLRLEDRQTPRAR